VLQNFNSQLVLLDRPGAGAGASGGMQEDDQLAYAPVGNGNGNGDGSRRTAKPGFDKKIDDEIPF